MFVQLYKTGPCSIYYVRACCTGPGRVTNIRPTEVLQDSITLKWDPPTEGGVVSYDILVSPSTKSDTINEQGTRYEIRCIFPLDLTIKLH